jgi:toxin FitB
VTRYLLDTNIISNVIKPAPSRALLTWMGAQRDDDLYIASLTIAEIRLGILGMPSGRKRHSLETWFAGSKGPQSLFAGRILPFDELAALLWAELLAEGRPRSSLDMIVASVALARGCVVVTDNEADFAGLAILDPLRAKAEPRG